jgi:hypothetical protein
MDFNKRLDVQFVRLLDEVYGVLTEEQICDLAKSMDLSENDIHNYFIIAQETFDAVKMFMDTAETHCVFCNNILKDPEVNG